MRMGVGISEVLLLGRGVKLECVLGCIGVHWYGNMVILEKFDLVWVKLDCGVPSEDRQGGTKGGTREGGS